MLRVKFNEALVPPSEHTGGSLRGKVIVSTGRGSEMGSRLSQSHQVQTQYTTWVHGSHRLPETKFKSVTEAIAKNGDVELDTVQRVLGFSIHQVGPQGSPWPSDLDNPHTFQYANLLYIFLAM